MLSFRKNEEAGVPLAQRRRVLWGLGSSGDGDGRAGFDGARMQATERVRACERAWLAEVGVANYTNASDSYLCVVPSEAAQAVDWHAADLGRARRT
jgi:hypothetical protein